MILLWSCTAVPRLGWSWGSRYYLGKATIEIHDLGKDSIITSMIFILVIFCAFYDLYSCFLHLIWNENSGHCSNFMVHDKPWNSCNGTCWAMESLQWSLKGCHDFLNQWLVVLCLLFNHSSFLSRAGRNNMSDEISKCSKFLQSLIISGIVDQRFLQQQKKQKQLGLSASLNCSAICKNFI